MAFKERCEIRFDLKTIAVRDEPKEYVTAFTPLLITLANSGLEEGKIILNGEIVCQFKRTKEALTLDSN